MSALSTITIRNNLFTLAIHEENRIKAIAEMAEKISDRLQIARGSC